MFETNDYETVILAMAHEVQRYDVALDNLKAYAEEMAKQNEILRKKVQEADKPVEE